MMNLMFQQHNNQPVSNKKTNATIQQSTIMTVNLSNWCSLTNKRTPNNLPTLPGCPDPCNKEDIEGFTRKSQ